MLKLLIMLLLLFSTSIGYTSQRSVLFHFAGINIGGVWGDLVDADSHDQLTTPNIPSSALEVKGESPFHFCAGFSSHIDIMLKKRFALRIGLTYFSLERILDFMGSSAEVDEDSALVSLWTPSIGCTIFLGENRNTTLSAQIGYSTGTITTIDSQIPSFSYYKSSIDTSGLNISVSAAQNIYPLKAFPELGVSFFARWDLFFLKSDRQIYNTLDKNYRIYAISLGCSIFLAL